MIQHSTTPGNQKKLARLRLLLADVLAESLKRGFYGTAAVELSIQDGTIQHLRTKIERVER